MISKTSSAKFYRPVVAKSPVIEMRLSKEALSFRSNSKTSGEDEAVSSTFRGYINTDIKCRYFIDFSTHNHVSNYSWPERIQLYCRPGIDLPLHRLQCELTSRDFSDYCIRRRSVCHWQSNFVQEYRRCPRGIHQDLQAFFVSIWL